MCSSDQNSTGECSATSLTDFSCGCKTGSTWNESESKCMVDPANLPECSSTNATPCYDSTSHLTWSARASSPMTWSSAKSYCESYSEGGLSGWHLPTIDELKTLLIANRVTSNCLVSETNNCMASDGCWSCSTCTQTGTQLSSGTFCSDWGTSYSDGRYSGDTGWFWSSSIPSANLPNALGVDFDYGYVYYSTIYHCDYNYDARCVRNAK